eukprot:TCONS_00012622-protein
MKKNYISKINSSSQESFNRKSKKKIENESPQQSTSFPPLVFSPSLPLSQKHQSNAMMENQEPSLLAKESLYYTNNECPFVQPKILQLRYLRAKDVRTRTAPSVKFCRGCRQHGDYHSPRCSSDSMYIRRLGSTSKHTSEENQPSSNKQKNPIKIKTNPKNRSVLRKPSRHFTIPDPLSRAQRPDFSGNLKATNCQICTSNKLKGIDCHICSKTRLQEAGKSDSFIGLKSSQDWMSASKPRKHSKPANHNRLRNISGAKLNQSLPNRLGLHDDEEPFSIGQYVDQNGNFLLRSKGLDSLNNVDSMISDKFMISDFGKLLAEDDSNHPTLSLLRIDGIRKMPLPPIRNSGEGIDREYFENYGAFLEKLSEDELRLFLMGRVQPNIKRIYPGYRSRQKQSVARHRRGNLQDNTNDLFPGEEEESSGEFLHDEDSLLLNSKSIDDSQDDQKSLKSLLTPSPPPTPPIRTPSPEIENESFPQSLDDDEKSLILPSESSIDPNFIEEYNKSLLKQQDNDKTSASLSVQSSELTVKLDLEDESNNLNSTVITPVLDQSPSSNEESGLENAADNIEQDLSDSIEKDSLITNENHDNENVDSYGTKEDDYSLNTIEAERQNEESEDIQDETNPLGMSEDDRFQDQKKQSLRSASPLPPIDESSTILNGSRDHIDQSESENIEIDQSQIEESNEIVIDNVQEPPPIVFEAPPIPALKYEYKDHQRKPSEKKTMFKTQEKPKKLKKPPKKPRLLDLRFEQFKAQRKQANMEDIEDANFEREGTMLDFASKYCILSLDQLNRYEKIFNEYSASDEPTPPPTATDETRHVTEEENENENENEKEREYENQKKKLPEELIRFVEEYEEICYTSDSLKDKMAQINTKKDKIQDDLTRLKSIISSPDTEVQADHLQKQASLTSRLHNIEKRHTETYEKQRSVQHIEKDLKEFLLSQEEFDPKILDLIKENKNTFARRFRKRKASYINSEDLPRVLKKLNMKIKSKELSFIEKLMQLPEQHPKLNLKMFSIVAAMTEKITDIDSSIKHYLDQIDLKTMERRLEKCKELYMLINEEFNKTDQEFRTDRSAENLFAELIAGGMNEKEMKSIMEKLVNDGRVDFLDFAMYIPLFIKIHETILKTPFGSL